MGTETPEWHAEMDKFDYAKLLQNRKPLVQCITNYVSMDIMANALNAVGASPAMVSLLFSSATSPTSLTLPDPLLVYDLCPLPDSCMVLTAVNS